jgi:hypothetical protein
MLPEFIGYLAEVKAIFAPTSTIVRRPLHVQPLFSPLDFDTPATYEILNAKSMLNSTTYERMRRKFTIWRRVRRLTAKAQ